MEIKVMITEEEILIRPNNYELGEYVQKKYWSIRNDLDSVNFSDEQILTITEEK